MFSPQLRQLVLQSRHNTLHAVCLFDLELVKKCADSSAAQRADKGVRAAVSRRRYSTVGKDDMTVFVGNVVAVDGDVVADFLTIPYNSINNSSVVACCTIGVFFCLFLFVLFFV